LITQGGFHPGLLAPLVRYMAADFEEYDTAAIGMSMNFRLPSVRAAREIIEEAYDFRADLYHDGQWRPARWSQTRTFDFGLAPGKRPCVAMSSLELRDLPAELGLRELGCYVAGFNWFVDGVVFPLIYLLGKIRKGLALDQMLRLFKWGMDTFSPAVPWTVVQLEAAGREHQQASAVVLRLSHADGYFFTAACVLAALRQAWGGALGHPGLRQMGLAVDPTRMLADLEALGVKVERW
ncbi:MAG: hypothetical protein KDC54_05040, partial [Lewinella sp.]|nr:hypothetical protein [Lewinella sp.]